MKKNYFMLAAATMMFAACAETDLVNEVNMEEAPKAIEFDAFANKTTRAEIGTDNPLTKTTLKVWGWKTVEEKNTDIFNGIGVEYDSKWTYIDDSDVKYWDQKAIYNFYAASPFTENVGIEGDIEDKTIKITGVTGGAADADATVDYLITRATSVESGATPSVVDFTLSHIMSKVTVQVKYSDELVANGATLTALKMEGWNGNAGTFTQNKLELADEKEEGEEDDVYVLKEWDIKDTSTGSYDFLKATATTEDDIELGTATAKYVGSYLMVPQTIAANTLKFTISYTITRGTGESATTETFTQQVGVVKDVQTWETNTHYVYTITIKPNAIEFGTATVKEWTVEKNEDETNKEYPVPVN